MKYYKKNKEELNYKKAYYYLFNAITDIIKILQVIQRKAENICVDETPLDDLEINVNETLQNIINIIKSEEENQQDG